MGQREARCSLRLVRSCDWNNEGIFEGVEAAEDWDSSNDECGLVTAGKD